QNVFTREEYLNDPRKLEWATAMTRIDARSASKIAVHLAVDVLTKMNPPDPKWVDFVVKMKSQNGGYQLLHGVLRDPNVTKLPQFSGWLASLREQIGVGAASEMLQFVGPQEARKIAEWALAKARSVETWHKMDYEKTFVTARQLFNSKDLPTGKALADEVVERAIVELRSQSDLNKAWSQAILLIERNAFTEQLLLEVLKKPVTSYGISSVIEMIAEKKLDSAAVRDVLFRKIEDMRRTSLPRAMEDLTHSKARTHLIEILSRAAPSEPFATDLYVFLWMNAGPNAVRDMESGHLPEMRGRITDLMEARAEFERAIGYWPSESSLGIEHLFDWKAATFQAQPKEFLRYMWDQFVSREQIGSTQQLRKRSDIAVPLRFFAFSNLMKDASFRAEFAKVNETYNATSHDQIVDLASALEKTTTAESFAVARELVKLRGGGTLRLLDAFMSARHRNHPWNFSELHRELKKDGGDVYWHRQIYEWVFEIPGDFDRGRHELIKEYVAKESERGYFCEKALNYVLETDVSTH
ncbi:MAG: hypothetical protein AAB250_03665, partial [Bdellovibrionota bacterium]